MLTWSRPIGLHPMVSSLSAMAGPPARPAACGQGSRPSPRAYPWPASRSTFTRGDGREPTGQERALAGVVDEAERAPVLGGGFRQSAEAPEKVGAGGGEEVVVAERGCVDRVQRRQARVRP